MNEQMYNLFGWTCAYNREGNVPATKIEDVFFMGHRSIVVPYEDTFVLLPALPEGKVRAIVEYRKREDSSDLDSIQAAYACMVKAFPFRWSGKEAEQEVYRLANTYFRDAKEMVLKTSVLGAQKEVVDFIKCIPGESSCYELYFGGMYHFIMYREGMRVVNKYLQSKFLQQSDDDYKYFDGPGQDSCSDYRKDIAPYIVAPPGTGKSYLASRYPVYMDIDDVVPSDLFGLEGSLRAQKAAEYSQKALQLAIQNRKILLSWDYIPGKPPIGVWVRPSVWYESQMRDRDEPLTQWAENCKFIAVQNGYPIMSTIELENIAQFL